MLHFECPSCKTRCEAAPEFAGKLVVCPQCGQSVSVPRDATAITEDAPPLPAPQRDTIAGKDRWSGRSIAKDGGAAGVWMRNGVLALVGLTVIGVAVCLLLPGLRRTQDGGARRQSTNNLKEIALACQSFHDVNKRMPFNGSDAAPADRPDVKYSKEAAAGVFTSGSWGFQILSYIDQTPLFTKAVPPTLEWLPTCARDAGGLSFDDKGVPWSDYFYNNYLNDPLQAAKPDAPDAKRTMVSIIDGTSFTILAGEGNINTTQYASTANVAGCSNIFFGGTTGTMRSGDNGKINPTGAILKRDSAADPGIGSWGGPFPQGGLMAMCDGTVRMFPYATQNFSAFLTPTGGENVVLPDT